MMNAVDAVLSYHLDPLVCGVAKFSHRLAEELGVRFSRLGDLETAYPLVSIKTSELAVGWQKSVASRWYNWDLFLHDVPTDCTWLDRPVRIYAANAVIAAIIRKHRPDVVTAFCPSSLNGNATRGAINVLSFGMAHKFQGVYFERLKTLLDRQEQSYTVSLSTGIHEGSPWDVTFTENLRLMRGIFVDHLRMLGFLADDALVKELQQATVTALFFEPAVRANNTSLWAALEANRPVITTLDADSPLELRNDPRVFNLSSLVAWPDLSTPLIGTSHEVYSWANLLPLFKV